jgi:hypothetical protein
MLWKLPGWLLTTASVFGSFADNTAGRRRKKVRAVKNRLDIKINGY